MKKVYWLVLFSAQMIPFYAHSQSTKSGPEQSKEAAPAESGRSANHETELANKPLPAVPYFDPKLLATDGAPLKISVLSLNDYVVRIDCSRELSHAEMSELAERHKGNALRIETPSADGKTTLVTLYKKDGSSDLTFHLHALTPLTPAEIAEIQKYNKVNPHGDSGSPMLSEVPFESLKRHDSSDHLAPPSPQDMRKLTESMEKMTKAMNELGPALATMTSKPKPVTSGTVMQPGQDEVQDGQSAFEPDATLTGTK